jgi:hypothetical protein
MVCPSAIAKAFGLDAATQHSVPKLLAGTVEKEIGDCRMIRVTASV